LKTVVIGAGRMGRRHMEVVRQAGLTLVGVADRNSEPLAAAADEYSVSAEGRFTDAAEMLRALRPECVVIATTAPTHCEYTVLAAELGARFILCEKPMATSLAECNRMIEACRKAEARLAINHQMRFMEQYTEVKRLVESEEFGGLASASVVAGNFGLAMNGTHYFEMFRFLTGETPAEVSAWFSAGVVPNPRGAEFEDRAGSVRAVTPSGKRFYLEAGDDQGHGVRVVYAGRYGQLVVDELVGTMYLSVREPEHRVQPTTRYGMPWKDSTLAIQPADVIAPTRAVLDALLAGDDYPTGEDGRSAVATLVAAYLSHERGHLPVALAEATRAADRAFPWA
jgi:predicted dehydrogenase